MRYRVVLTVFLITEISLTNKSVIKVSWLCGGIGGHGSGTGEDVRYALAERSLALEMVLIYDCSGIVHLRL